ncbi:MAG: AMP-binding protein [Pseudomonadota bacterium]
MRAAEELYFDSQETRDPQAREASLFARLPDLIAHAKHADGWAELLDGVDPAAVTDRASLAQLPVLRKSHLVERQAAAPPLGGFSGGAVSRLFASPGPIYEPQGGGADFWRSARALYAAGIRRGDILHNTFSYHLTPGGWIMDAGARHLGCTVIPAGPGNSEQQLAAIAHLKPSAYAGVPDYLKILLDKGEAAGSDTSSILHAFVSGGPLFPSLREEYESRGISCMQGYATADAGMISYETRGPDGVCPGMVVDEDVIVEIVTPGTGDPVAVGDVGEIVVTVFNRDYPMIRFATGDMSAVLDAPSPCGRTNMRIKGWMGRADQAIKVKGMFVRPEQIAVLQKRFPDLGRLRLVVTRDGQQDVMTLHAEAREPHNDDLAAALSDALRAETKLGGAVTLVGVGTLANDGQVIVDERSYD